MKRKSGWLLLASVILVVPVLLITKGHAERITSARGTPTKQGSLVKEATLNSALLSLAPMQAVAFDGPAAPLTAYSITKSATPASGSSVGQGQLITYTITITNGATPDTTSGNGFIRSFDTSTTDTAFQFNPAFPTGVMTQPGAGSAWGPCTITPNGNGTNQFTCYAGDGIGGGADTFAANQTVVLKVDALVSNTAIPGTVANNTAFFEKDGDGNGVDEVFIGSNTVNHTLTSTTDLAITKVTSNATPVAGGAAFAYTLTVTNHAGAASNVVVSDPLPAGIFLANNNISVVASPTGSSAFSCTGPAVGQNGTVNCTSGYMAVGATATFTIVAQASRDLAGGVRTNTATVTSSTVEPNPNLANPNTASAQVTLQNDASISIAKTATAAVCPGDNVTYNIAVTNAGNSSAVNVLVTDVLPPNTSFVSVIGSNAFSDNCNFNPGTNTLTCTAGFLQTGTSNITLVVKTAANTPLAVLTNNATLAAAVGTITGTNPATISTSVVACGPPSLQFNAPTYSVNENTPLATITVTRTGTTSGTATVNYATSNGTATATADYGNTAGTLTFGPGVTSQTFDVPILDDSISEGTESVNLTLSGPTGGAALGSQNTAVLLILDNEPPLPNSITVYAVTVNNNLLSFNSTAPNVILSNVPITGLQPGELIVGIDFRPATGQLYALGNSSRLYIVNTTTGVSVPVAGPFSPVLMGIDFGSDFNPMVDRLRVVSDADQNFRLNPSTGAVVGSDSALAYASGDSNFGSNPNVVGAAYTNSFAGASILTTTTLYGIDSNLDILVRQGGVDGAAPSPNTGQLTTIGPLGVNPTGLLGFDIQGSNNKAFAAFNAPAESSKLYTLNLSTGAATLLGTIGRLVQGLQLQVGVLNRLQVAL